MRKLYFILTIKLVTAMVRARSPQKMSYQFINRDADNKLVTNHSVGNHHPQFVYDEAYKQLLLKIKSTFIGNN